MAAQFDLVVQRHRARRHGRSGTGRRRRRRKTAASPPWAMSPVPAERRSTPRASPSRRASSTSTPTVTGRRPRTSASCRRSGHGVTTVVMGNCGVGFAPCRPQDRDTLMKVMEGVEDIPELVMRQGVPWNWQELPRLSRRAGRGAAAISTSPPRCRMRPCEVFVVGRRGVDREARDACGHGGHGVAGGGGLLAGALGFTYLALAVPSHVRRRAPRPPSPPPKRSWGRSPAACAALLRA